MYYYSAESPNRAGYDLIPANGLCRAAKKTLRNLLIFPRARRYREKIRRLSSFVRGLERDCPQSVPFVLGVCQRLYVATGGGAHPSNVGHARGSGPRGGRVKRLGGDSGEKTKNGVEKIANERRYCFSSAERRRRVFTVRVCARVKTR